MRTRSPALSDSTSASLSGGATSLIPSAAVVTLTASPPCADVRDTRFPRRGAVPPFRTSPHPVAPAKPALEPRGSQRHLLVPMRVTLDGDGDGQGRDVAGGRGAGEAGRRRGAAVTPGA